MTTSPVAIPSTRISNMFVTQRMTQQVQGDSIDLYRVMQQLSTGQRITLGSEDPLAAQRIMMLQRSIARNNQVKTNLTAVSSYFSQTDSALASVASLVTSTHGLALTMIGDSVTNDQRAGAAQQVQQVIAQLVSIGNQQLNSRSLFAGSNTPVTPYTILGNGNVQYNGNEGYVMNFGDLSGFLINTNVTGAESLGGLSSAVTGLPNLTPTLSANTRLADLNGGQGVSLGSITVTAASFGQGTSTATIDLSHAETVGDVVRLIQNNPSLGQSLHVDIGNQGINLSFASGTGNIYVTDIGSGTTARDLGILTPSGSSSITGSNLRPQLTTTTPLADLLGTKSQTVARFAGVDNDIVLQSQANGPAMNGVTVQFVDKSTMAPGGEYADYTLDGSGQLSTITVYVRGGMSTAASTVSAINRDLASVGVQASLDPADDMNGGKGIVSALAPQTMSGGSGQSIDLASGLQIVNNDQTFTVDLSKAKTVQDVLNTLNASPAGVVASINSSGNGIDIRSKVSGSDFMIGENGGTTAADLGVRSFTLDTKLNSLNRGAGVPDSSGTDFTITTVDGTELDIDISGCQTVGDVIATINDAAASAGVTTFHADLTPVGNGIRLVDDNTTAPNGQITVTNAPNATAANALGLIPVGSTSASSSLSTDGSHQILQGSDTNPASANGLFDALLRLQHALENNDNQAIGDAISMLDTATQQLTLVRAQLGAQAQAVDTLLSQQANMDIQLQSSLSNDFDTDYAQAISEFASRQTAYQAALQTAGSILKMTLLDYI